MEEGSRTVNLSDVMHTHGANCRLLDPPRLHLTRKTGRETGRLEEVVEHKDRQAKGRFLLHGGKRGPAQDLAADEAWRGCDMHAPASMPPESVTVPSIDEPRLCNERCSRAAKG